MNQGKFKGTPKGPWTPKKLKDQARNDVLDLPCHIHTKKDELRNLILPKHTTRQCRLLIQSFQESQPSEKDKESNKEEDKEEDGGYPNVNATLVTFANLESKSRLKVINREVNMVAPSTTRYLKWSKIPITFDQRRPPNTRCYPWGHSLDQGFDGRWQWFEYIVC